MSIVSHKQEHVLEVWGDFACFSRPEMAVERYSYPLPTPSAARAVFEAVYHKPEFFWQIVRLEMLSMPALIALRRNEVKDKLNPAAVQKWIDGKSPPEPLWADGDQSLLGTDMKGRTQRQTIALRNPRFRLTARIVPHPGKESRQRGYDEQFVRRASRGKCFAQPYLGCREFVAFFRHVATLEGEPAPVAFTQDLGWMLYDTYDFRRYWDESQRGQDEHRHAPPFISVFEAFVKHGVLEVPPFDSDKVHKPDPRDRRAG